MREVISTVHELADLGVTVISVKSQTGPITSTMGRLLWAIQAWYAEMENDERSESIRAGHAQARASGKQIGLPRRVFVGRRLSSCANGRTIVAADCAALGRGNLDGT
jgi:DNA invertase Pin-like site-specific DNA recombinase